MPAAKIGPEGRAYVLKLAKDGITAVDLASMLDVNYMVARQYLLRLESDGAVCRVATQRGANGRPRIVYRTKSAVRPHQKRRLTR